MAPRQPEWAAALRATFVPNVEWSPDVVITIVAILGTTISPYLFFWQTSEEVEEEREQGIDADNVSPTRMRGLLRAARFDVTTGMLMANVGFYFVVLTSAATLYASGQTDVETASQAAEVLRPLAGQLSSLLFALGIIGTGLLAVPVLAGAAAYATAELFDWPEGLSNRFRRAPQFYGVIAVATLLGMALSFVGIPEMQALFLAAVLNGVIAPVLLLFIMLIARDRRVLGDYTASRSMSIIGWTTAVAMFGAAVVFFITLI